MGKFKGGPYSGTRGAKGEALTTRDTSVDDYGHRREPRRQDRFGLTEPIANRGDLGQLGDKGSGKLPRSR